MGTAGRSAPLRRTGSLLALLGAELAGVLILHWLGRFPGLRIRWDEPVPWLLSSPVQEVLGAILRSVALVMAYWLLVSTVIYLLASLSRLPSAVRAVAWATFPLARRVADHAVAVTLATSMVGTTTLGVASPALAADDRGRAGPPARKPVTAAQAAPVRALGAQDTTTTRGEGDEPSRPGYTPNPADQAPSAEETTPTTEAPATNAPTTTEPPTTSRPSEGSYTPTPADQAPRRLPASTTTTEAPTTTEKPTTTTERPTTTTESTTTLAPTTTAAPPTSTRQGAAATTSTTGLREPGYTPTPGTPTPKPPPSAGQPTEPNPPGEAGGGTTPPEANKETSHEVASGENLWTIAQNHLEEAGAGGAGEPTTDELTMYWERVKEVNRGRLESGDPDIIRAGETVILPPVASSAAAPAPEARGETTSPAAPGDSLWTIAQNHLAAAGKGEPSTRQVTDYWERLKQANRGHLRSGDPDLIYPGEEIILPPLE